MDQALQDRVNEFVKRATDKIKDRWIVSGYTHGQHPILEVSEGSRYIAIFRQDRGPEGLTTYTNSDGTTHPLSRSIHAFIDKTGGVTLKLPSKIGDIYKPASYKAPAKHARGNIFAEDYGMSCMSEYGPNYLK